MRKKLFFSLTAFALVAALVMCMTGMGALYIAFQRDLKEGLVRQADTLAALLKGQETPAAFLAQGAYMNRVTLVDTDGQVLYDSSHAAAGMDNHQEREEIERARQAGEAFSVRSSATVGEVSVYYARLLPSGQVLRLSGSQQSVWAALYCSAGWIVLAALMCVAAAALLARTVTRRLVAPINAIDLDQPLLSDAYEELSPVLRRMDQQNRRIEQQMSSLRSQRSELDVILGGMREGLILLDEHHTVLTMNAAAREMLGAQGDPVGKSVLQVNRSGELIRLLQAGSGEGEMGREGRMLHVSISTVAQGGMVILLQDVTDARQAEESRRQFTANVSHELRTPLTTICGYAELLSSGMARAQDAGEMGGRILKEGRRLLSLIEDIIRLSRLDEGVMNESAPVALRALTDHCLEKLRPLARAQDITLTAEGGEAVVQGDRVLLEEMLTNLIENGVKYNRPGGSVTVSVWEEDGRPHVRVSDTGVGIAPEHQARVFERFYRVDKSRSKQTGGTGLGLSIVKHGAQVHHAEITLESRVGQGTAITLAFPAQKAE